MKLPILPQDKANHVIYGMAIYAVVASIFAAPFAFIVVFAFAIGKETFDVYANGKVFSYADWMFTVFGGLLGLYIGLFT